MEVLKYPKFLVLFLVGISLGIGFFLWRDFSIGYFSSCPIKYDKYDHPVITVKLQGIICDLEVRVGSRFPLFLSKKTLDQIDKKPQGTVQWHDINGQESESLSYLIPKMKIGDLTLKNILANQALEEENSVLGKCLGGEFNLFLDFPHSRIIACDTFSRLQSRKLADSHWVRVPFELKRGGIVLQVNTDLGLCKLAINTTSTFTLIRPSRVPSGKSPISSIFSIGEQNFGEITFQSVDLPDGLSEIDGFIGMDFLKNHAIYLDFTNKTVYIEPPQIYFEYFPITFSPRGIPATNVSIQGNIYSLELDLGSGLPLSLTQEILQNIHKIPYGTAKWSDFKGNKYQSLAYKIPEIKVGNLTFVNVLVNQNREDFHANAALNAPPSQQIGAIGLPILKKYNLLLDFRHSAIYASNSQVHLQQSGLLSKNLLSIPFVLCPDGILLAVETDTGIYRLLLDTAATHTAIRTPHSTSTSQFRLMGHDFGMRSLVPIDLSARFDYDGYLGLDFLREYSLFIDYPNKLIFLDLQKSE